MIYLGVFYKDNGQVKIQEFYTLNAVRTYIRQNENKYLTFDIYQAKCINKKLVDKNIIMIYN